MTRARITQVAQTFALAVVVMSAVLDWRLALVLFVLALLARPVRFVFWEAERAQDRYRANPDAPHAARRPPFDWSEKDAA